LPLPPTATTPAGTFTLALHDALPIDAAANGNTVAIQSTQAYDTKAPGVVITDDEPGTANIAGGSVVYTFTFSEPVTGFDATDIVVRKSTRLTSTHLGSTYSALAVTPT